MKARSLMENWIGPREPSRLFCKNRAPLESVRSFSIHPGSTLSPHFSDVSMLG